MQNIFTPSQHPQKSQHMLQFISPSYNHTANFRWFAVFFYLMVCCKFSILLGRFYDLKKWLYHVSSRCYSITLTAYTCFGCVDSLLFWIIDNMIADNLMLLTFLKSVGKLSYRISHILSLSNCLL